MVNMLILSLFAFSVLGFTLQHFTFKYSSHILGLRMRRVT